MRHSQTKVLNRPPPSLPCLERLVAVCNLAISCKIMFVIYTTDAEGCGELPERMPVDYTCVPEDITSDRQRFRCVVITA